MLICFTPRLLSPSSSPELQQTETHLQIARLAAQPTVGLALPGRGGVGAGPVPAPSVSALSHLVSEHTAGIRDDQS